MWVILGLLGLPLVEIALFVLVGGWIGLWPTLGLVVLAAVGGLALVRREGARAMADLRRAAEGMRDPTLPVARGALVLLAGLLLALPGFLSDLVALALLIPPVRDALIRALGRRVVVAGAGFGPGFGPRPTRGGDVIDGEYREVDTPELPRGPSGSGSGGGSGWTRH